MQSLGVDEQEVTPSAENAWLHHGLGQKKPLPIYSARKLRRILATVKLIHKCLYNGPMAQPAQLAKRDY